MRFGKRRPRVPRAEMFRRAAKIEARALDTRTDVLASHLRAMRGQRRELFLEQGELGDRRPRSAGHQHGQNPGGGLIDWKKVGGLARRASGGLLGFG